MSVPPSNLEALASMDNVPAGSPEEALSQLERLTEIPSSAQMLAALDHFKEALRGMDDPSRELAREGAVKRLCALGFASPGRIVDSVMPPSVRPAGDLKAGCAVGFKEPEPWPEAVDGAALLARIEGTVRRYLAIDGDQVVALSLWSLFAHAHEAFEISPILALTSPDKGCGKSTALALLGALVPKPLTSANITPSAVFRVTDYFKPTLLLDEADTFLGDSEGLRGILNSGHMRSQAYVTRVVGDDFQVCMFSTWTPKVVALIGELPGTLADRSITLRMRRRAHTEHIERLQLHRLADMEDLRSMAARWALDHLEALRFAEPEIPGGITRDRTRDNWRPLLAIADELGQEWPWRARESAFRLSQHTAQETSVGVTLLEDLRDLFTTIGKNRLESEEILRHLHAMEERLWPDWRNRGPISAQQMAGLLHPFGLSPVKWKQEGTTSRGYQQGDFGDAFSRYLPPEPPPAPPASFQSTCAATGGATGTATVAAGGGCKSTSSWRWRRWRPERGALGRREHERRHPNHSTRSRRKRSRDGRGDCRSWERKQRIGRPWVRQCTRFLRSASTGLGAHLGSPIRASGWDVRAPPRRPEPREETAND
jgi:putative DNA primase/helicase